MKAGIIGYGISGRSAEVLLKDKGYNVVIYDDNIDEYKNNEKDILNCDLVIVSPGIKKDHHLVQKLVSLEKEIIGEIELAYRYAKGKIIAITGTNGKTTTTAWIGHTLKLAEKEVFVGGNMSPGEPFSGFALNTTDNSWNVIEVSSFQLTDIKDFHPNGAIITNISPDHLNWHKDMQDYLDAKLRIFENTNKNDIRILNFDDEQLKEAGMGSEKDIVWFSGKIHVYPGVFLNGNEIFVHIGKESGKLLDIGELSLAGYHNMMNFMAMAALLISMGINREIITESGRTFRGVSHRMEIIGNYENRLFVNNSMCTNPVAFEASSSVYAPKQVLIVGGRGKSIPYDKIVQTIKGKAKGVVLIGESSEELEKAFQKENYKNYCIAFSMKEAVLRAFEMSDKGDTILLSPGYASFDWFKNFAHRGEVFKKSVKELFGE